MERANVEFHEAEVPVDSGLLYIIDPCYIADAHTPDGKNSDWYSTLIHSDLGSAGSLTPFKTVGSGQAHGVVFATGGDGSFRVSTEYDADDQPVRIVIDLLGWVDDPDEI